MRGSTPTTVEPIILARAFRPYSATASSDAIRSAAAPSLMPEALPAVTVPSALTTGLNLVKPSSVVANEDVHQYLPQLVRLYAEE